MNGSKFDTAEQLLTQLTAFGNIHIECNQEKSKEVFEAVRQLKQSNSIGYIIHSDKGYERESVQSYLRFFSELSGSKISISHVLRRFALGSVSKVKIHRLTLAEQMRVHIARISMQEAKLYFLEEPLLNLDSLSTSIILEWISSCCEIGIHFITTNSSMRHTLLMPGTAFYVNNDSYIQAEQEEFSEESPAVEDIRVLKLSAKSGNSTLLFEPKDIDFVESLNKCNYISVRGTLFQISQTMDEIEQMLEKSGFYRCHRSYIVNMQKVEQIEKLSKNSFALLLGNQEQSRIPLSKGRIADMKETFGW